MQNKLNILFIEDNPDDVLLISRKLKKDGLVFTHKVVKNPDQMIEALENEQWDLMLSDFALPNFTGLDALQIYKKYNLDIPFILISGTIGEEIAVKAMKEGVHDYLMKDHLERLVPAIERELREFKVREENRNAEQALRDSEKRYRELVEMSPDGIIILHNERIIYANNSATEIFGFEHSFDLFNEEIQPFFLNVECFNDLNLELNEHDKTTPTECILVRKDRKKIHCELAMVNIIHNGVKAKQLIMRDITKRIESEKTIKKLSKAVVESPVAIIITDPDGLIEYINPKFEETSGFTFGEIRGQKLRVLREGILDSKDHKDLWDTIRSGNEWKGEVINKTKEGKKYWENVVISPIFNGDKIEHFVIVKEDITTRKEMETELIEAKEKAENSEKLKSEFLAQMSHEIRSPINVVLSFSNLIKAELGESLADEMQQSFQTIDSAGRRIIRTIDLILNMSEIQTDSYDYVPRQIDLNRDIIDHLVKEYQYVAKDKGLDIKLNLQTEKAEIVADEYSLTQVFANLIDNAINYTESGSIDINVNRAPEGDLEVEVTDTGIGIAEEYIPNLFKPFTQESQGYTRKFEGNGLGLALVQNYCELNNADIRVESKKNQGSKFTVKFKGNS